MTPTPQGSQATPEQLRETLRDIMFKAAGGIKDNGDEEIDTILAIFATFLASIELPEKWERRIDHDAEFCETCSQLVVESEDDCLCTARNRGIDQSQAIIDKIVEELK